MLKYLNNRLILVENDYIGKKEIMEKMADLIEKNTDLLLNKKLFLEKIMEREEIGTTGIGKGIAVPHARCEELSDIVMALAVLKQPIDFNTPDEDKARVILLVGAPKDKNNEYLDLLATIAKSFRKKEFRDSVTTVTNEEELLEILAGQLEQ